MSDEYDDDLELEIFISGCRGIGDHQNLRCRIDFTDYEWFTKVVKKAEGSCEWKERFNVGSFDEDDSVTVFLTSKRTNLGKVTVLLKNLNEDSSTPAEYALEPCTSEDGRHLEASEVKGSVVLSFAFVQPTEATESRKKRGFFRRLCAFLVRAPTKSDVREAETSDAGSDRASVEGEAAQPSSEHNDSGARTPSARSVHNESQKTGNDADATESEVEGEEELPETQLFNIPLKEVLAKQAAKHPDLQVPYFIWRVCQYIREEDGIIETVGLFRVRGRLAEIRELKAKLNAGVDVELDPSVNIHNVTSLVKSFLRELPVPLITHEYYSSFLKAANYTGRQREKRIVNTIRKLPPENQALISFLVSLMHDVSLHSAENKMPAENLGKVLSPNLLWREKVDLCDLSQVRDMKQANELTEVMIVKYHEIFDESVEWSECEESDEISAISSDEEDEEAEDDRGGLDNLIKNLGTKDAFASRKTMSAGSRGGAALKPATGRAQSKTLSAGVGKR